MIEVGYGLITCQTHPDDPRGWEELYSEALELATLAESSGAESIWVSEHHFVEGGYLPALLPMMAALAAVTRTAKIGSAMVLAPFYDPLRLAEDAAVTDLISQGRVILGLSMGWLPQEFAAFGKSSKRRVRLLVDAIQICRTGWAGEPTTQREDGTPFGVYHAAARARPDPDLDRRRRSAGCATGRSPCRRFYGDQLHPR